ncbi:hypothetical protein CBS470a_008214 [Colletotrichum nupharicola]|nr:hypothetical protein CBS470a_008214 [Colletotrichum nupharicola]
MGKHNVVIAILPKREYGISAAATVARDLFHSFPNIRIGLMVGVGGGAPTKQHDIRLGDVVIGSRDAGRGGVIQYDYGKMIQNQAFVETGSLNQPPPALLNAVAGLETDYMMRGPELDSKVEKALTPWKRLQKTHSRPPASADRLCKPDFTHPLDSSAPCSQTCHANTANIVSREERGEHEDNPTIHYGLIASANQVMKNTRMRDKLSAERGVLCFEMEAAGLMNHFPCLVIRGICDYSDSHKSKEWQGFAAMVAAAYAKGLLLQIAPSSVEAEKPIGEVLSSIQRRLSDLKERLQDLKLDKAEDLSVARSPHFVVPFPPDPDFVDRSDIWTWIEDQYAGPDSRFALVGMGGFGKSQMAIQFAYQLHDTSPKTSIFWVNASTKATFEESYRSIADVLALPRRHDPDVNILALVRDWLQREEVSPWLMIVDNADDVVLLFSEANGQKDALVPTASYLPKTDNGKILVTSRSWDAAEKLVGKGKMIFRVPTMKEAQALQLLRKKLDHGGDEVAALRLVHTLGCIPLAVNQAAAYIYKRSQRSPLTIQSYLDELQKSGQRKGTLLRSDRGDVRRYDGVSNSVVLTWQLTFNQIKWEQPRAANLLSLMSYFHAQNIHQYMLHGYNSGFINATEGDDDDDLEDDLDVLHAYSLISTTTSGFCEMHPLVQFCTKLWISEFGSPGQWKTHFLQSASEYFPSGKFETWQQCQTLMPHVQPLLDKQPLEEGNRLEWSKLLTNVSWYLVMLGNYSRAEVIVQQAVSTRTEILGQEHPSTLTSMAHLASTYSNQGRWKEAEELQAKELNICSRVLGEEHPDTLAIMHNLAFTWKDLERWEDAMQLLQDCVRRRENVLGVDHPETMSSVSALSDWELDFGETSREVL